MKFRDKNQAVFLGIRVGFIFLITVIIIIFAAYYTLSQNFQTLLANYTIKLVQAMVAQGVDRVESELAIGRKEAAMSAAFFDTAGTPIPFFPGPDTVRMVYVTQTQTIASDGRKQVINDRPDIRAAFGGKIAVYGPYFNERHEFVICYSAPVIRNGKIRGALSIEKNGYTFCRLIESIRFINTGESYIINAEGTDIAVSDPRHMEWVTSQYNAKKILSGQEDAVTRSILELEQKGLDGEKGIGTYFWKNGLVYVIYEPIPSVGWVLFGGLREEELAAMTQSVFFYVHLRGAHVKNLPCRGASAHGIDYLLDYFQYEKKR